MNRVSPQGVGLEQALREAFQGDGNNTTRMLQGFMPSNNVQFKQPHDDQFYQRGMWWPSNHLQYLDPPDVKPSPEMDPAQSPLVRALLLAGQGLPVGR